ncbi:MAG: YdcF family protein [Candidatus Methylomirabilales bacterium]
MGEPRKEGLRGGKHIGSARILRFVGLAGVALFLASAFTPLPNLLSRWLGVESQREPAEAIVVLGGGVHPDGELSDSSMRRAVHGMVLHRKGLASLLVFAGPARNEGPAESQVRAQLARDLGTSPELILTEADARTTREEAIRLGVLLRARGARKILLVTDSQHMTRARGLFEREGFEVFAAPADDFSSDTSNPGGRLKLMRQVLQEFVIRIYYRAAGYL